MPLKTSESTLYIGMPSQKKSCGCFKSDYFSCHYESDEDVEWIVKDFFRRAGEYIESMLNATCSMCRSPIDRNLALSKGFGELSITFGYGSAHDSEAYSGFLCDRCFEKLAKTLDLNERKV